MVDMKDIADRLTAPAVVDRERIRSEAAVKLPYVADPSSLLLIQRLAGNSAVAGLFQRPTRPARQTNPGGSPLITWAAQAPVAGRLAPDSAPAATPRLLELPRMADNRAAAALAAVQREKDSEAGAAQAPPPKHVTGYLGLNPKAGREAAGLRKASKQKVLISLNNPAAEKVLAEDPAVFTFVDQELGIGFGDFDRWNKATDVLLQADPRLREQLADLMRWFNGAERGEIVLERIVLSGHSNGVELWGEAAASAESKPGTMLIERDLMALTAVFPKAAAQVQDILFSACFSINAVEIVIKLFPNLRTCWSYSKFSPSVASGSIGHLATWAVATEGEGSLTRRSRRGTSALWTREKGYVVGDPSAAAVGPLYTAAFRGWQDTALPMYAGHRDVDKAVLNPVYERIQQFLAHPGVDESMRRSGTIARDIVLRLRFWPLVRERFGSEYASQLRPAYEALGLNMPAWSSLTRVALKAHVETVNKAIEAHPDQASANELMARLLKKGLYSLDTAVIRSDWI